MLKIALSFVLLVVATSEVVSAQELLLSADDRKDIESVLGSGIDLAPLAPRPLLAAPQYLPKNSGPHLYTRKSKGEKDAREQHRVTAGADGHTYTYEIAGVGKRTIVDDVGGNADTISETDEEKKVISTFSPAQPLIIAGLMPGESRKTKVKVSVADADDPTDEDYQGALDVTVTALGHYRVTVPAGTYEADLVKWTYEGDIGPADVETTQYRFLAEAAGLVAMVEWRSISAMLLYHEKSRIGRLYSGN